MQARAARVARARAAFGRASLTLCTARADFRQDADGQDHHAGGGVQRHHRQREGQDSGQGGCVRPAAPARRVCRALRAFLSGPLLENSWRARDGPRAPGSRLATPTVGAPWSRLAAARANGSARCVPATASALDAANPWHRLAGAAGRTRAAASARRGLGAQHLRGLTCGARRGRPWRASRAPEAKRPGEGPTSPSAFRPARPSVGRATRALRRV